MLNQKEHYFSANEKSNKILYTGSAGVVDICWWSVDKDKERSHLLSRWKRSGYISISFS